MNVKTKIVLNRSNEELTGKKNKTHSPTQKTPKEDSTLKGQNRKDVEYLILKLTGARSLAEIIEGFNIQGVKVSYHRWFQDRVDRLFGLAREHR